jgi:hypothetical protein
MKRFFLLFVAIFSATSTLLFFSGCSDDTSSEGPEIRSFTPTSGTPGQAVVLTGKNFNSSPTDNYVVFNGTAIANVIGVTGTTLTVKVPNDATTGKIRVTINGKTAVSADEFQVVGPTITSFLPSHGVPGTTVTILGSNFSITKSENIVTVNGVAASVETATNSQLTIKIPEEATTGKIKVTFAGRDATSTQDFEVLNDIPQDGLVAFYPFSSNANDVTANASNGTVSGAALSTDRFGTSNHSYLFDGVNDVITVGNPTALQLSNTITVGAWINISAYKSDQQAILTKIFFDPDAGNNPTRGYYLAQDFTGGGTPSLMAFSYSTAGLVLSSYVGTAIDLSEWIHVALTIDDKTWKFYQNGSLTHSNTGSNVVLDDGTVGPLTIGSYGGGFFFDGKIDDITIYNRALSAAEVQQLVDQNVTKY